MHLKTAAPASKSYLQRAIAISAMAKGTSVLKNVTWCNDSVVAAEMARNLGAHMVEDGGNLIITTDGLRFKTKHYSAGEAGLSARMFSPILALCKDKIIFTGEGSLLTRPVAMVTDALTQLGAKVESNNGLLPLTIKGSLKPGTVHINGSLSSQLLTGLLIALPTLNGDSTIVVENLKSKAYIDMTLSIMKHFGVDVKNNGYRIFYIRGNQQYKASTYTIEGDWSAATFFLVQGAVKGSADVFHLNINSKQADRNIILALQKAGASVTLSGDRVHVKKKSLNAFEFDATGSPDLFPPLACLASQCKGTSIIKGVSRLTHKESNRGETIQHEFKKMGIDIVLKDDLMFITGAPPMPCTIRSHNDHRIAMAGGIMNLFCEAGTINIHNKEAVNKSFPGFFKELEKVDGSC